MKVTREAWKGKSHGVPSKIERYDDVTEEDERRLFGEVMAKGCGAWVGKGGCNAFPVERYRGGTPLMFATFRQMQKGSEWVAVALCPKHAPADGPISRKITADMDPEILKSQRREMDKFVRLTKSEPMPMPNLLYPDAAAPNVPSYANRYSEALETQIAMLKGYRSESGTRQILRDYQRRKARGEVPSDQPPEEFLAAGWGFLARAEPYYWSPAICTLLEDIARTIPEWTLTAEALPTPAGYFHFARSLPLPLNDRDGYTAPLCGIGWNRWTQEKDQSKFIVVSFLTRDAGDRLPWAEAVFPWGMGVGWQAQLRSLEHLRPEQQSNERFNAMLRYAAAGLSFLQQRILIAPQHRAERAARRRVEAEGWTHEPLIRVVELRRKQSRQNHSDEHDVVDWACQWVVSGHWRQQWYPSLQSYQPKWIMPYVKGPEDKPLKPPRAKVFAVVR